MEIPNKNMISEGLFFVWTEGMGLFPHLSPIVSHPSLKKKWFLIENHGELTLKPMQANPNQEVLSLYASRDKPA